VTFPDVPVSAAGSLRPATSEAGGSDRQLQDLVYCPSTPPVTGCALSVLRPVTAGSQEVALMLVLAVLAVLAVLTRGL